MNPPSELVVIGSLTRDSEAGIRQVTEILLQLGANIEASRVNRLGGLTSLVALVKIAKDKTPLLSTLLSALPGEFLISPPDPPDQPVAKDSASGNRCELTVECADHPGIIHTVTEHLAEVGIRIRDLESSVINAPFSGDSIFQMRAVIELPDEGSLRNFQAWLSKTEADFGIQTQMHGLARKF